MRPAPAFVAVLTSLFALLQPLRAQSERVQTPDQPLQVAIVGASVSAGCVDPLSGGSADNSTVPLLRILKPWLAEREARVQSRADMLMFQDAETKGRLQIERTLKSPPDLVFAVDFLFWFGYGRLRADDEAAARLRRFEAGLGLLAQLQCPVVVGDLPDVTGASARMISPAMIPAPAVLARLNERLRAWAAERRQVVVFPVAELVLRMKRDGVALPLAAGELATPPGGLMQGDRLHANRLGMAWLGFRLQDALRPVDALDLPAWSLEQFVAAAGAEADLADLAAAGK
jgi:hypothetical protein